MLLVRVEPAGLEFSAREGQTVMAAALESGLYWPTVCGGLGTCRTCALRVVSGVLAPVSRWEADGLREVGLSATTGPSQSRLACQALVGAADVVVHKVGVRPA
jgi:ferredoxin